MATVEEIRAKPPRNAERNHPMTFLPEPHPEELWCPIISTDDHVLEPYDLFTKRVPSRMREEVPYVVVDDQGVPAWIINGRPEPVAVLNGAVGRPISEWDLAPQKYEEFRTGVFDVHARVADMDLDGVWASLCFPSVIFGFAGTVLSQIDDERVALGSVRAYNDWVIEEWAGAHPDRFIPSQVPWMRDPTVAAEEIRRNAERGFRAVSFSENPEGLGFPGIHSSHWDPFLAACEETETIVNLHVGSSGNIQKPSSNSPLDVSTALFPVNGMLAAVDWVYSKIPLRFPGLKIVLSEAGASWVPTIIERFQRAYRQIDASIAWHRSDPSPMEVFRRAFYFTSIEDPSAFHQLETIGVDHLMVEADYPHQDSTWPVTQTMFRRQLAHLDEKVIRQLCYANAASLYRHPEPPTALLETSVIGQSAPAATSQ